MIGFLDGHILGMGTLGGDGIQIQKRLGAPSFEESESLILQSSVARQERFR